MDVRGQYGCTHVSRLSCKLFPGLVCVCLEPCGRETFVDKTLVKLWPMEIERVNIEAMCQPPTWAQALRASAGMLCCLMTDVRETTRLELPDCDNAFIVKVLTS